MKRRGQRGVTLPELLIALFIFALISGAAVYTLRLSIDGREQLAGADASVRDLQMLRIILREDVLQLAPRAARDEYGNLPPAQFLGGAGFSFRAPVEGETPLIAFVRDGDRIRRVLGYMPDFLGMYDDLTVSEYLQFFAAAYGVARSKRMATVDSCLELTDLTSKKHTMVEGLSRGMQQRLGVARVLLHDPKVLLLDEPASGLDPRARIEMRSLLTELKRMGKTLMVSSHILSELGEMSDSIGIIERGKLVYSGTMHDALSRVRKGERLHVRLAGDGADAARVAAAIAGTPGVARAWVSDACVNLDLEESPPSDHDIVDLFAKAGARVARLERESVRLEDAFLRLTTGQVQ